MRISCETGMERDGGAAQWNADPRFRCHLWIERRAAFYRHRVPDRTEPFPNGLYGRSRTSVSSMHTPLWREVPWILMDNEHPAGCRPYQQFAHELGSEINSSLLACTPE
jgi:hypothetical protein